MPYLRFFLCITCLFSCSLLFGSEENFLLVNGRSHQTIQMIGSNIDERLTPCSTFKIVLSLIGFDIGLLNNENNPSWVFQEGYDDFLDSWKSSQTPYSWMKTSCIWVSRLIASEIGLEQLQKYLNAFNYGNQDSSGGLTNCWLSSSLKISPKEQVHFIEKIVCESLPISSDAIRKTKALLLIEELPNGWTLFGKTGSGSFDTSDETYELGWFVGWIEKDHLFFPFAYNIRDIKINTSQRVPRVKKLLKEANIMCATN